MTDDHVELARAAVRKVIAGTKRSRSKEGSRQFLRRHLQAQPTDFLIAAALEGDADSLDILRGRARDARKSGAAVSTQFNNFVWHYFIDGPLKAAPGPKVRDTVLRNSLLVVLVKIVNEDFGLPIYRSPDRRNEKSGALSACAIVAQEVGLSERQIEDIWDQGKDTVDR